MDDLLTSPATVIFLDTLNVQNGLMYLGHEVIGSIWAKIAVAAVMWAAGSWFCIRFLRSDFYRKQTRVMKFMLLWGVISSTLFATYKNILSKSASDDDITLVSVYAGPTNGVSRVDVVSTGGGPSPMWYRNAKDETWIKGVDNGWTLDYAEFDGTAFRVGWVHSSTNDEVTAYNMWYFGDHPPAVEIVEQGGLHITGFAVCGNYIQITWKIDADVELPEGSEVSIECVNDIGDGIEAWVTAWTDNAPTHMPTSWRHEGFHLDRTTKWRVRLEVPE